MRFEVSRAKPSDAGHVVSLFRACYGDAYPFKDFYEEDWVRKGTYDDSVAWLVAREAGSGDVVGTGAVMLEAGDHDDLLGEFGRLAVHPRYRGSGVGRALVAKLVEEASRRVEFGFAEARTAHVGSQKILGSQGFFPVGYEPLKYCLDRRESVVAYGRLFGQAARLRKRRVLVVPEVEPLARHVLRGMGLETEIRLDPYAGRYPADEGLGLQVIDEWTMPRLLKIELGRVVRPEVFGHLHLNYGFFKIVEQNAQYLVARDQERLVGAVGYTYDYVDEKVKVFELVAKDDFVKGFLVDAMDAYAVSSLNAQYVEVDVSAYSPRMQKTFLEFGHVPVAYFPAMVFQDTRRLDVVRFAKVNSKQADAPRLLAEAREVRDLVAASGAKY
ncbi:MAG: hypothetical protein Kow0069_29240 [Promethearchaeota archaeon]